MVLFGFCTGDLSRMIQCSSRTPAAGGAHLQLRSCSCVRHPGRCKCIVSHLFDQPTAIIVDVYVFQYLLFLNRILYYASITLAGTIAAERFLVVFFPFRIPSLLTPQRIKYLAISVYTVNLVLASPGFFCFTHVWVFDQSFNTSLPVLTITDFYKSNYEAVNINIAIVYNNFVLGTSMVLTLTLTPAIAVKLWLITRERQKLIQKKCSFDLQVAKILIAVCSLSLCVYGPFICYITSTYFTPGYSVISNSFKLFTILTDFSGTICASLNFVIYVTMSSKFRKQYRELISAWC
ncbi:hypothetical protein Btru_018126 [Bulinus truncatus]|nr:hypothetical protein Btru_018126 [Bulinus truncatus]